jgi:hypothetical protein
MVTTSHVSQMADRQVQAGMNTVTMTPLSQITDGPVQGPKTATYIAVSVMSDGQLQAPMLPTTAVSVKPEGQPQAPTASASAVSTKPEVRPRALARSAPDGLVACRTSSSLEISLKNGILTDSAGRTGYIASNYQFQFDKPPQAGAIYTAGFSLCANGSLALGGSNVFWQCLSGNFYNLYDRYWAAQCSPIIIELVTLVDC